MRFPLILPSLNFSSIRNATLSNLPALALPPTDLTVCDDFYAGTSPLDISSCMRLVSQLPQGSEPISYYVHPETADQRRRSLPIVVGRRTDPCQIQVHVSGPAAASIQGPYLISPKEVRNLAAFVIWHCVGPSQTGGAATLGMRKSLDWLTDVDTVYPGPAPRGTTFLSLHVWNGRAEVGWNAGNQDPGVGSRVYDYVRAVYSGLPETSERYSKLDEVLFDLLFSTSAMLYGSDVNWFDDRAPPEE